VTGVQTCALPILPGKNCAAREIVLNREDTKSAKVLMLSQRLVADEPGAKKSWRPLHLGG
jgi:hypothetical protein